MVWQFDSAPAHMKEGDQKQFWSPSFHLVQRILVGKVFAVQPDSSSFNRICNPVATDMRVNSKVTFGHPQTSFFERQDPS